MKSDQNNPSAQELATRHTPLGQRERVLYAIGDRWVTSEIVARDTGLSLEHCSSYLCELERKNLIESLGEFWNRSKAYVLRGNRKHDWLKKQLITPQMRADLKEAYRMYWLAAKYCMKDRWKV